MSTKRQGTTSERIDLNGVHANALIEFDRIESGCRDQREESREDRRFYSVAGAQWEGKLSRQFENKPKYEINKIQLALIRIFGEYRNNRITVDFVAKDGSDDRKLADTLDKLYRSDEQDSSAQEAYDNAFDEAIGGGMGAWRLRAEYEDEFDEENEKQRIAIEPIYDADRSVFFDLDAKKQDKSDAKFCFVVSSMTKQDYIDTWDDDPVSWPVEYDNTYEGFRWCDVDVVYVAEYYRIEKVKEEIFTYELIDGSEQRYSESDFENDDDLMKTLKATGAKVKKRRKVTRQRVHKYILSGGGILEDAGIIAGRYIPIVPMYGKRWFIDSVERFMGHVRLAKDPQRLYNMQLSKLGEISALSTVEKPIMTPEQVEGHVNRWVDDNIENYPFQLVNPIADNTGNKVPMGPLGYTKVPNVPPAMAALIQLTNADITDVLGNPAEGEKVLPNLSGKAIELVQSRLDNQTFIYMSNMAKAIQRCGQIWLEMAKELYVEEGRRLKGVGKRDNTELIELMRPVLDKNTGEQTFENDLSKASFNVTTSVGPSFESQRQNTIRILTTMLQFTQDPETIQIITASIMANMEGPGLSDINEFYRQKLVRTGVITPTDEERQMMEAEAANRPPDANQIYLQSAAENEKAKAASARADTVLTIAKVGETESKTEKNVAETMETLSKIPGEQPGEKTGTRPSEEIIENEVVETNEIPLNFEQSEV